MESDDDDNGRTQSLSHVCKVQLSRVLVQGYALNVGTGALHDGLHTSLMVISRLRSGSL